MRRRVLILAYKFPDLIVPGGSTRVEKFVKYLPRHGWDPIVLSVRVPEHELADVHRGEHVVRTPSHYGAFVKAYRTRYLDHGSSADARPRRRSRARGLVEFARRLKNLVLVPDDAVLWWPYAIPAALKLIRRQRPAAIFASGPPYSLLLLGALLKRLTGVPLLSDLRDDWAKNPLAGQRNAVQAATESFLERRAFAGADRIIHVTPGSLELYRARYPRQAMALVRNGYDEEDFAPLASPEAAPGRLRMLHVGSLKEGRSPRPIFEAMRGLSGAHFRLIGTTHREHVDAAASAGLNGEVQWTDRLPRCEVVTAMGESDALVLIPTRDAPTAIPGKAYEYLRAERPILVVSARNETTRFLAGRRGVVIRAPGDVAGIRSTLEEWRDASRPAAPAPPEAYPFARRQLAGTLATHLADVARPAGGAG